MTILQIIRPLSEIFNRNLCENQAALTGIFRGGIIQMSHASTRSARTVNKNAQRTLLVSPAGVGQHRHTGAGRYPVLSSALGIPGQARNDWRRYYLEVSRAKSS